MSQWEKKMDLPVQFFLPPPSTKNHLQIIQLLNLKQKYIVKNYMMFIHVQFRNTKTSVRLVRMVSRARQILPTNQKHTSNSYQKKLSEQKPQNQKLLEFYCISTDGMMEFNLQTFAVEFNAIPNTWNSELFAIFALFTNICIAIHNQIWNKYVGNSDIECINPKWNKT